MHEKDEEGSLRIFEANLKREVTEFIADKNKNVTSIRSNQTDGKKTQGITSRRIVGRKA